MPKPKKQPNPDNPWFGIPAGESVKLKTRGEAEAWWANQAPEEPEIPEAPKEPTLKTRFPTLADTEKETETEQYYKELDITKPTGEEEEDIRERYRKQVQPMLDEIEKTFGFRLAEEALEGKGFIGQTRAMVGRGAGLGSPRGQAKIAGTTKRVGQIREATLAEKRLEIAKVLDLATTRADERLKSETELAKTNMEAYLEFQKGQQEEARANIVGLAQMGVTSEELEAEGDLLKNLQEQSGLEPMLFEVLYNANLPEAQKIDWKVQKLSGDKVLFYGVDPATGELTQKDFDYSLDEGEELKIIDDVAYGSKTDDQGNIVLRPLPGQKEKKEAPVTKLVSGNLYQYDDETDSWKLVVKKTVAGKKPITLTKEESMKWFGTLDYAGKTLDQIPDDVLPKAEEEDMEGWEYTESVKQGFIEEKAEDMTLEDALTSYGPTLGRDWVYKQYGKEPPKKRTAEELYTETYYQNLQRGLIPKYDKNETLIGWEEPKK